MSTLTCADFDRPEVRNCCVSCHEDANQYGFDLLEYTLQNGGHARVCCSVGRSLHKLGLVVPPDSSTPTTDPGA